MADRISHRKRGFAVAIASTLLLSACDSPTGPDEFEISFHAPRTVQGTLRPAEPIPNAYFLECILPVRLQATGEPGDSATWSGGYWEYGPLGVSSSSASRTFTADDLAAWWAFGSPSIRTGEAREWDMWFGFAPQGYWVRGYFTYDTRRGTNRIEYEFTCQSS